MFGRQKQQPSLLTPTLWRIIFFAGVFFLVVIVIRLITIPTTLKAYLEDTGSAGYTRLISLFYPLDPTGSEAFASLVEIIDSTTEDISTRTGLLTNVLRPLQQQTGSLYMLLERFYPQHARLFHEFALLEEDIASLLGMEDAQTYLIVLQNTAEKRPNGGFFGSFALVTFAKGKLIDLQISDSYHPAYNRPTTKILGPEWFEQFLPERDIYFIGANKVGFTYHDGPHIKTLYEKSYPGKSIRGVIFLRTDMFVRLLPKLQEQLWARQYSNATVDLVRGEQRRGKKEYYLASLEEYINEHRGSLLQEFWKQLPDLLAEHKINIYLDTVSGKMHTFLRRHKLTTRFEEQHAYFRDSNIVFNKLDTFVQKNITLTDSGGEEIAQRSGDIIKLPTLSPGNLYTFTIAYTLDVPTSYNDFIRSLNEQYGITLGQREEHILGTHHAWATRGNIYFPPSFDVLSLQGDLSSERTFSTPFSQNAAYETFIEKNKQTNTIRIQVMVE